MPRLDWTQKDLGLECRSLSTGADTADAGAADLTELEMALDPDLRKTLAETLEQQVIQGQDEVCLVLPTGWTVWWKLRPLGSRLLLSHPAPDTWVGTLALTHETMNRVIVELRESSEPGSEQREAIWVGQADRSKNPAFGAHNLEVKFRIN